MNASIVERVPWSNLKARGPSSEVCGIGTTMSEVVVQTDKTLLYGQFAHFLDPLAEKCDAATKAYLVKPCDETMASLSAARRKLKFAIFLLSEE